jgi:peptidoglycan/LPS O-acetylase OafA/YrhL
VAPSLQRCLAIRPLVVLGRMSFSLYVIHLIIECSLGCHIYLICIKDYKLSHEVAFIWAATGSLSVSLALAWCGSVTIEPLSIWLGKWIFKTIFEIKVEK